MRRHPTRLGRGPLGWLLLLGLCAASGCTTLATAMYLIRGPNVDPDFDGLEGKRVAVACRPVASLEIRSQNVAQQMAQTLSRLLAERVLQIEVIDQQEVADWVDNNLWDEYTEIGRALDADLIVGVDIESFRIYEGQTIYRGKAEVTVRVYDCGTGELSYQKHLPQVVYPPNRVVPASEQHEAEFRREFVGVLADQVGRLFYPHDHTADFALDAASMD